MAMREMRTNTYDPHTKSITVSEKRAAAIATIGKRYTDLFSNRTPADQELRQLYAMPKNAVLTATKHARLQASSSGRPGRRRLSGRATLLAIPAIGRTSPWSATLRPDQSSCGRSSRSSCCSEASADWSGIMRANSMFGGGHRTHRGVRESRRVRYRDNHAIDARDRQIFLRRHSLVLGPDRPWNRDCALRGGRPGTLRSTDGGIFPYAITRTWHTQLAVLWIATAWLATGLYVAPLLGGREPNFQRLG